MTSHLLLEGILDVKDPRGSEDRKFWKAWRQVWVSFSVIYPSGRKEPYLQLSLSQNSLRTHEKEVNISRDGLRLFRCRSKTRPYRTWAIASGSKVVLYFATENEVQGQNWMQSLRDGLWPPCFSFQMLTDACSQEVSLIDDDNTFMSGLLGVYGRFVLTSEDMISLIHPHWGATLLEISLDNIKDVLFVRKTEITAGVFSIVLKRVGGSKVKSLQFFCNTAKDAIQWILSKIYKKEIRAASANKVMSPNQAVQSESNMRPKSVDENVTALKTTPSIFVQNPDKGMEVINSYTNCEYENLRHLKLFPSNTNKNGESIITQDERVHKRSIERFSEHTLLQLSSSNDSSASDKSVTENKEADFGTENNIYANLMHETNFVTQSFNSSANASSANSNNEYETKQFLNERIARKISFPVTLEDGSDFVEYDTINKNEASKKLNSEVLNIEFSTSQLTAEKNCILKNKASVINTLAGTKFSTHSSESNCGNAEANLSSKTKTITDAFLAPKAKEQDKVKIPEISSVPKDKARFSLRSQLYSTVNKSISKQGQIQNAPLTVERSLNDYRDIKKDSSQLLPNIPSNFLDTSINSALLKNDKTTRESFSSDDEDDGDISMWLTDDLNGLKFDERLYEDIRDRKGTVYEEIDSSEDEDTTHLPPELPERPKNLEIPDSLRLQMLSKSITQTLKVMEDPESTIKEYPHTKFIKKIRDTSRIMQLSPNHEHAKEHFVIETKLPVNMKTE